MAISLFHLIGMVERRRCLATLVEDKDEDEKEKEELIEWVSRMVAILTIC